jgi:hypothetical protein
MIASASLGDRCPTFRHRVMASSSKEEKIKKNDLMDLTTI